MPAITASPPALLLAGLLLGCDAAKDDPDLDGDGHPASQDCDDGNPDTHPGAAERCDGQDNDCDGAIDEQAQDAATWHPDDDGDGFGDGQLPLAACDQPSGHVGDGSDCDDDDAEVRPDAQETCDGRDEDCDGQVDEALLASWYPDEDLDGYGDPELSVEACDPPQGWTADNSDCDDGDGAIHPGAEETCNDQDDDCDGVTDDDASDAATWYADADGDGYGDPEDGYLGCWTKGHVDDGSDCDDGDAAVHPDASETSGDGVDSDCDGRDSRFVGGLVSLVDADAVLVGESSGDGAGCATAGAGDLNGDGHGDLLVGALFQDEGGADAGAAYLLSGPLSGSLDLSLATAKLIGENEDDHAGETVAAAGDVDADGYPDLLVGSSANDAGGSNAGALYLVRGPLSGSLDLSLADAKLLGEDAGYLVGHGPPASGDVDGDGHSDLLVGAIMFEASTTGGCAYLVRGPVSGELDLSQADAKLTSEGTDQLAGRCVAIPGDVDGDGFGDLWVGANWHADLAGAAYLVLGPVSGTLSLGASEARFTGENRDDLLGHGLAGAGDANGDGYADLLVGAYLNDEGGEDAGAAYLLYGPLSGQRSVAEADGKLVGESAFDWAGSTCAGGGDIDQDGYADLLVGALYDDGGGADAGAAYLVLGPLCGTLGLGSADARLQGAQAGDYAGGWNGAVSFCGDPDADGVEDLCIGAFGEDAGGSGAGAAFFLSGAGL